MSQMLDKLVAGKISRLFLLLFNRAVMYNLDHDFTQQSITEFTTYVSDVLSSYSPIVLIMHQNKFFVEDEPFDPKMNISRLVQHYKKTGTSSLSLFAGLTRRDVAQFVDVFVDNTRNHTSEMMTGILEKNGVETIKINHVFYQKVSVDDQVINKKEFEESALQGGTSFSESIKGELLNMVAGSLVTDDASQQISLAQLMADPDAASHQMMKEELAAHHQAGQSGSVVMGQLKNIKKQLANYDNSAEPLNLKQLAGAVFEMKKNMKIAMGECSGSGLNIALQEDIIDEATQIADDVIVRLVKSEYAKEEMTISRLAQIIRRIVSDREELLRLMPKFRKALTEAGMPLNTFKELALQLEKELATEDVVASLTKGAEKIGVSGDALIREICSDSGEAAELIYLASEIKKQTGDEKALTNILVDYVEKISSKMVTDADVGDNDSGQMRHVVSQVENELLSHLRGKDLSGAVLDNVIKRLDDRLDSVTKKLKADWLNAKKESGSRKKSATFLDILEETSGGNKEFESFIQEIKDGTVDFDLNENSLKDIMQAFSKKRTPGKPEPINELPKGTYNKNNSIFFAEKEMLKADRYKVPFSAICLAIMKIQPKKKVAPEDIKPLIVMYNLMALVHEKVRDTDIVGMLDSSKVIVLLPFTGESAAKLAMRRLIQSINSGIFTVNEIPMQIQVAGAVTPFDSAKKNAVKEFISTAESRAIDMVQRIRNVQSLY